MPPGRLGLDNSNSIKFEYSFTYFNCQKERQQNKSAVSYILK